MTTRSRTPGGPSGSQPTSARVAGDAERRWPGDGCCGAALPGLLLAPPTSAPGACAALLAPGRWGRVVATDAESLAGRRASGRASTRSDCETASTERDRVALVVVLESLGDEVHGPRHREGDEDQCAGVHAFER